ncbi:lipase member J-like [Tupaia chinensis]|uniref:lipase member J-like n=1 Tax=Tupaia chinensis TaxID=246437 RepID=UPI000FFC430A|nr:lipase member J-like [Tupaia chinensis]
MIAVVGQTVRHDQTHNVLITLAVALELAKEGAVSEIISYWNYPSEEYDVVTDDGYILGVNRIPHGKRDSERETFRPAVLLMHGLFLSATCWVSNLPNNSLAFILADAGYDVWMGNFRGNTYFRKHIHLSPESKEFWSFSFDEMAKYDLPALINFVVKKTGQEQIYYVGHSQGTVTGFIAFSNFPEVAQRIKVFFALAPVFYLTQSEGPIEIISQLPAILYQILFPDQEVLPHTILSNIVAAIICKHHILDVICGKMNFALFGFNPKNVNMSRIDVYLSYNPAGSSLQNVLHYKQAATETKEILRAYDFGSSAQNMKHYNQPTPPKYNVKTLKVRTATWNSLSDVWANPRDAKILLSQIPNLVYSDTLCFYQHIDFVLGKNATWDIYYKIIQIMKHTL